ncbi:MAG: hypothetical protein KBA95_18370, partial [Acidobacteria bacterium]|nr:hypothetical protein [Acidobacteriota bacterium]
PASSLMATLTSAVGVTLPFAAYTGVATMLSIFLGPIGWTVSGSVALFGVGNAIVKRRRQRLAGRFVSFVIFLIGLRRRKELATSERAAAVQAEIKTLEQQLDRLDETDIRKEAGRNIRRSLSDRRLVHARLKAQEREYREVALQPGREVPVKSGGNHTSIFGSKRVTCIADIPVEQVRKMFHKIVEHTGVTGIFLGAFDRDRGKPYPDPKLKLKMEKNKLTGSLLTKARRGNCCSIRIAVLESWEPEVLHHIRVEGYLLE